MTDLLNLADAIGAGGGGVRQDEAEIEEGPDDDYETDTDEVPTTHEPDLNSPKGGQSEAGSSRPLQRKSGHQDAPPDRKRALQRQIQGLLNKYDRGHKRHC